LSETTYIDCNHDRPWRLDWIYAILSHHPWNKSRAFKALHKYSKLRKKKASKHLQTLHLWIRRRKRGNVVLLVYIFVMIKSIDLKTLLSYTLSRDIFFIFSITAILICAIQLGSIGIHNRSSIF
jgi:hypothetical protein